MRVTFKVLDRRASKHGQTVTVSGDRIEVDQMNPSTLILWENGSRKTTFKKDGLIRVQEEGGTGAAGLDFGGLSL